jgi:geranylgeranyl diphosphate synthase type II
VKKKSSRGAARGQEEHTSPALGSAAAEEAFDLKSYIEGRRRDVDAALEAVLPPADSPPPRIHEAMRYAVFAGGKRLRPILVLAACESAGGEPSHAIDLACAAECVHTYSLVHDDLPSLDNDDLRRGRPTVHKAFDDATAVLAGDALLTFAVELALGPASGSPADPSSHPSPREASSLRSGGPIDPPPLAPAERAADPCPGRGDVARPAPRSGRIEPAARLRAVRCLIAAIGTRGMIGGQVDDLLFTGQRADEAIVRSIHARKTGALLRACVVMGGIAAGASEAALSLLDGYGADFGLAFQIIDDILDIEGTTAALGKSVGKDVSAGKATFPAAIGIERSRSLAEGLARRAAAAARSMGIGGRPLAALAEYVVRRDR